MEANSKPLSVETGPCSLDSGISVVTLSGYLDTHTVLDFDRAVAQILQDGIVFFIIDASDLNYISSAGIGSLMRLVQDARQRGGDLVLLRPPDKVYQILELLGFTNIFLFASSLEEAVQSLRGDS